MDRWMDGWGMDGWSSRMEPILWNDRGEALTQPPVWMDLNPRCSEREADTGHALTGSIWIRQLHGGRPLISRNGGRKEYRVMPVGPVVSFGGGRSVRDGVGVWVVQNCPGTKCHQSMKNVTIFKVAIFDATLLRYNPIP